MNYPKHFMVDIETTGTVRHVDKILQVACVEMRFEYPYWMPTGREFVRTLHYAGQPESEFAKKHMVELYKKCNDTPESSNCEALAYDMKEFIHQFEPLNCEAISESPKHFMGWNASGFDIPFLFDNKVLTPSWYQTVDRGAGLKDEMRGDVHYRIYEQTGSLQFLCNLSGLDSKTIQQLAMDLNPTNIDLPQGKSHDALYDCYKQIIMQNGMIAIARMGVKR